MIGGPPVIATFWSVCAVDEADPLAIRRDEWPAHGAAAGDRHRFERVERADEELRAVVADVDDVRPVG